MTLPVAIGAGLVGFIVGIGFGVILTLIFAPATVNDPGAKAHEREHDYYHHPLRKHDDA